MREFRAGGKALPEDGGRQALNVAGAAHDVAVAGADSLRGTRHPAPLSESVPGRPAVRHIQVVARYRAGS